MDFQQLFEGETANLIYSIIVIFALFLFNWIFKKIINKKVKKLTNKHKWRKTVTYLSFISGVLIILWIWIHEFQQLATFLGLVSAGIAISLREPLSNLLSWLFIIWKRPFSLGDRIEIDEIAGDVIDIRPFQFSIIEIKNWVKADQSTGRVVHIPNHKVLSHSLANYTADFSFIWHEIPVLITLESNWQKAKNILLKSAQQQSEGVIDQARREINKASRRYVLYYRTLTPIVYTSVDPNGILLTIRYLSKPQQRRSTETIIWENVLKEFSSTHDINLAYPTRRFFTGEETLPDLNFNRNQDLQKKSTPGNKKTTDENYNP